MTIFFIAALMLVAFGTAVLIVFISNSIEAYQLKHHVHDWHVVAHFETEQGPRELLVCNTCTVFKKGNWII